MGFPKTGCTAWRQAMSTRLQRSGSGSLYVKQCGFWNYSRSLVIMKKGLVIHWMGC